MPNSKPSPKLLALQGQIDTLQRTAAHNATTLNAQDTAIATLKESEQKAWTIAGEWQTSDKEKERTIAKSRDEFGSLKEQFLNAQLAIARLEGYRERVEQEDDNRRPPFEMASVGTPDVRGVRRSGPFADIMRAAAGERRHWLRYGER